MHVLHQASEALKAIDITRPSQPVNILAHYSFDYAQQVKY